MKHRHSVALTLLTLFQLGIAAPHAAASTPSPEMSTIPDFIRLVGTDAGGVPDPLGTFTIAVRWRDGRPFSYAAVVLDFTDAPDLLLCEGPGIWQCNGTYGPYVQKIAGVDGMVTFTLPGRADHSIPHGAQQGVKIFADGVQLGTVPVSAFDHDGGGMGAPDQALWIADFFSGQYHQRSDFDGDGTLGANDLAEWREAFFGSGSILNCSVHCP